MEFVPLYVLEAMHRTFSEYKLAELLSSVNMELHVYGHIWIGIFCSFSWSVLPLLLNIVAIIPLKQTVA